MDIIKVKNTAYSKYEEVLLRRDNLRKEAEQIHMDYLMEFGGLITEAFERKIDCIRKKKMIAYCQRQVNQGRKIDSSKLDDFIVREMAQYEKDLQMLVNDVKAVREGKRVSASEYEKVKKIYYKLVKMIHPDLHPELADDEALKDYWQRILIAYTYNRLKDLEELELLVTTYLKGKGIQDLDIEIEDLDAKIATVEEEIRGIVSTKPYIYKKLLGDRTEILRRKQEYQDEIASYEMYSAQLDEVLATFEIERGKLS